MLPVVHAVTLHRVHASAFVGHDLSKWSQRPKGQYCEYKRANGLDDVLRFVPFAIAMRVLRAQSNGMVIQPRRIAVTLTGPDKAGTVLMGWFVGGR